jgi:hypothetical protein
MKTVAEIKGNLINGIYTKFYYMGKSLCYQIVINYNKGEILYKDFKDYNSYQDYHKRLIDALNSNKRINGDFVLLDTKQPQRKVASK